MAIQVFGVEEWLNLWENDAVYDMPGYARLGYCGHTAVLKQGLEALSAFLRQYD